VRQDFPWGVKEFGTFIPIVARPTSFVSNEDVAVFSTTSTLILLHLYILLLFDA
jgi:hypothetical protein